MKKLDKSILTFFCILFLNTNLANADILNIGSSANRALNKWLKEKKQDDYNAIDSEAINKNYAEDTQYGSFVSSEVVNDKISLNQAISFAINRHPTIKSSYLHIEAEKGNIELAQSSYKPRVNVGFDASGNLQNITENVTNKAGDISLQSSYYISISQLLYDFGKTNDLIDRAKATARLRQAEFLRVIDDISLQTSEAIIDVARFSKLLKLSEEQRDAIQAIYTMSRERAKAGLTSESDPVQVKARVDSVNASLYEIKAMKSRAIERLRTLTGKLISDVNLSNIESAQLPLNSVLNLNVQNIPSVLIAKANLQVAEADVKHANSDVYPNITLDTRTSQYFDHKDLRTMLPNSTYTSIGIGASASLYQGGAAQSRISMAHHNANAAVEEVNAALIAASDAARYYKEVILGYQTRIEPMKQRTKSLDDAKNLYKEQYTLGTRSILDLLNTEQDYFQAVSDEISIEHDLWGSKVQFINVVGMSREFYNINNTRVQGIVILP